MLSIPEYGWTNFSIGDAKYQLSYMTDVPIDWLKAAIFGLKNFVPFAVYGDCETYDVTCTVTEMYCHVICERDIIPETYFVNMTMIDFCKALHADISTNIDAWSDWMRHDDKNFKAEQKHKIQSLLDELGVLIDEHTRKYNTRSVSKVKMSAD